jgi:hypothetical protein
MLKVESPGKCEGDKKLAGAGNGGGSDVSSIRQQTSADVSRRQKTSALQGGSSDGLQSGTEVQILTRFTSTKVQILTQNLVFVGQRYITQAMETKGVCTRACVASLTK